IPQGTAITYNNWKQYARFMPVGMQTLFAGDHFWKMPPDIRIEVGPTLTIPVPHRYLEDTAKYGGQVKLERASAGGYSPVGYVAGIPFPDTSNDSVTLLPYELFYDTYYHYAPRLQHMLSCNYALDSYGNSTQTEMADAVYLQLTHLSDAGFPQPLPQSSGNYLIKYYEQLAPEQGKYTTSLVITSADITHLDEIYMYLPSARRALRMSQASRCAPTPGSDWTWDE